MTRRLRHLLPPLVVAAAALLACSEVGTEPGGVAAISFDTTPSPSIVIGDTLRDESGAVAPLRATAFDVDGDPIADAPIRWFSLSRDSSADRSRDTLVVDSITGIAFAPAPSESVYYARRNANARVVPQIHRLPGPVRQLPLTLRPDWLAAADTIATFGPARGDTAAAARTSQPVQARVLHDSAGLGTDSLAVRAWRVRYAVEYRGTVLPAASRTAWIVDDSYRRTTIDTTDGSGVAARRVRVLPESLAVAGTGGPDSITVIVTATYKGQPLAGSPRRVKVPIVLSAP